MTRSQIAKQISEVKFQETHDTVNISYLINGHQRHLLVDKIENVDLVELIDEGPVCLFEAINMVIYHEQQKQNERVIDLTSPQGLFEQIANIARYHNKSIYGV